MQRGQNRPDGCASHRVGEIVEVAVHHVELFDVLPEMTERDRPVRSKVLEPWRLVPNARPTVETRRAEVRESPEANSVTSWPRRTSSSVSVLITRAVPP
jgi:hypothetical protein